MQFQQCQFLVYACIHVCMYDSDPVKNISSMQVHEFNVFESVREVTEYVQVHLQDPSFVTLRYLRNLRTIQGRRTTQYVFE